MARKVTGTIGMCLIAAACFFHASAAAQEKPRKREKGGKIGVVDINAIAEHYEKHREKMEKLKNDVRRLKDELEKLDAKLKGLMERREMFDEGSAKYEEYTNLIEETKIKGIIKRSTELKRLNKLQKKLVKSLYDEIRAGVREYAQQHGYSLVLVELGEVSDELLKGDIKEILNKINIRSVIYAADELNITDKVIDYMNTKYRKEMEARAKAGKGGGKSKKGAGSRGR